jgi:hypothetical protein
MLTRRVEVMEVRKRLATLAPSPVPGAVQTKLFRPRSAPETGAGSFSEQRSRELNGPARRIEVVEMRKRLAWVFVVVIIALGGCGAPAGSGPVPEDLLPASGAVTGWERSGEAEVYVPDDLFDYMDGQAELFFVYNFERLATQEYTRGQEGPIIVEVYQVTSPADAYGLFSFYATGEPVDLGSGGAMEPGRLISFWRGRFYARVFAYGEAEQESLLALARQVAAGMPEGGALPELVARLPQENLVPGSARFFHQKLSLDNLLWLGDENILNLSEQTDAVLAAYAYDDAKTHLLVVEYPDAAVAEAAHAALEGSGLENLSAAGQSAQYLVAVFGAPDQAIVHELLQEALDKLTD